MDVRKEDINEDSKDRTRGRRRQTSDDVSVDAGVMEGCCGHGRVWIFLVLGILALVFSAVLVGVYMNVRALTTSMDNVEVMPSFVPAAAGGVAGLLVLLLFWKRYKILVYGVLVVCAVTVVLCVIAAVLTGTHVLQPMLSVSGCVYSRRDKVCRCFTQFRRDQLELERVVDGEQVYLVMHDVTSCADVEDVLPGMLFTMIGIYGVVSLVCAVAGVISLLVYQTEQRRKYLEDIEDDTYSPPSSPSSSDNYAEHHTMLPNHQSSASNATTLVNIYTNPNTTTNDEDNNTNDDGNTTPSDLIYSPSDVPMGYAEACSMRRCQSFSQPRQGLLREGSPGSSSSSQTASLIGGERILSRAEGGAGKLQEHRKKGRRAVTLHGLDREQLLLILSLQMRYLQESDQSSKREGNNNCINLNNNNVGAPVIDQSQDQADSSLVFSQLQRRAMTPTPRQERLSSSRTTDDDLDYRPAKLARSHTPQPYHFKNQNQYVHNINQQPQLQAYQCHPCQQQKQQQSPQLVNDQDEEEEEEAPPTMITYDLRNVTKTGPIVYENLPSAISSLNYYSPESQSSNSSPLLPCAGKQTKPVSGLTQTSQIKQSPVHQPSGSLNQVAILGGNIQGTGSPHSQFSRQSSQVSTSSQPSLDSSPSDTRKLVPSKEKTPEPGPAKGKAKKKVSKKEKNVKKEDEATSSSCAQASGLSRTDSNASKGAAAKTDRWQTLMEDDPRKVQTLWENVQRKIVSDPQTPDSTLDMRHPPFSEHHFNLTAHGSNTYISPQMTPGGSFPNVNSQKLPQQLNPPQVVPNGILKNPNVAASYLPGVQAVTQKLPSPLNPSQNMHYPNPNPVFTNQQNTLFQNAFIPIANSSTEYYEDLDEVFPAEHQQAYFQGLAPPPADAHAVGAPPKPPRVFGRQMTKFGTVPSSVQAQPVIDSQSQKLRPKSYMNAVDREVVGKTGFVNPTISTSSRGNIPGMDTEHHMMTHLLMEGPVKDNINCNVIDKAANECGQIGSDYLYAQPQRRFNPSSELLPVSPDNIYQNAYRHPDGQGQLKNIELQQQHFKGHDSSHPQWSAFQSFNHNQMSGSQVFERPMAGHEICDTDLDDLPRPRPQKQHAGGQVYPPPNFAVLSMYQSAELVNRPQLIRTGSSSSGEPHNTSCTSSERSGTPTADLQKGFQELRVPDHTWGMNQTQSRAGQPPSLITDRRFCITQQRQQQQQQMVNQLQQQQNACGLGSQQMFLPEQSSLNGQDQAYMVMRKLHAEERNRPQPAVDVSSHRHMAQASTGTIF